MGLPMKMFGAVPIRGGYICDRFAGTAPALGKPLELDWNIFRPKAN